jgi:hypothetical protein
MDKNRKKVAKVLFLLAIPLTVFIGCKKEVLEAKPEIMTSKIDGVKIQRMKKFISVIWEVPVHGVDLDTTKNQFKFKDIVLDASWLENIYDSATNH